MTTSVSGRAEIVSWSKDSIFIRWRFEDEIGDELNGKPTGSRSPAMFSVDSVVRGYFVRYQAVGSSVVQYSRLLDPSTVEYVITHLHENTNYEICIVRVHGHQPTPQPSIYVPDKVSSETRSRITVAPATGGIGAAPMSSTAVCVKGTTATDSLSVALGSMFGAFLALGFIVVLVFVAKWQHRRRMVKREATDAEDSGADFCDGIEMMECVETMQHSTGAWQDDSTTTDAPFLSGTYDVMTTPSLGHRRSSSAIDSDVFDASRPISRTPPPLFDAGSTARLSDEDPQYYYYGSHSRATSDDGSNDLMTFEMMTRATECYGKDDWIADYDVYRHRPEDLDVAANVWNYEKPQALPDSFYCPGSSNCRLSPQSEFIERSSFTSGNRSIEASRTASVVNSDGDQPRDQNTLERPRDRRPRDHTTLERPRDRVLDEFQVQVEIQDGYRELSADMAGRLTELDDQGRESHRGGFLCSFSGAERPMESTGSSAGDVCIGLERIATNKNRLVRQVSICHEQNQRTSVPDAATGELDDLHPHFFGQYINLDSCSYDPLNCS